VGNAETELGQAREKLGVYQNRSAPLQVDRATLRLERSRDNVGENEEELTQLHMMYDQEDFADKTKEIVLGRAQRRLDRSKVDLQHTERDLDVLRTHTVPMETASLDITVTDKAQALEKAREELSTTRLNQVISVMEAEFKIVSLEEDLAETRRKIEKIKDELAEHPEPKET
jgi:hypothetical protein